MFDGTLNNEVYASTHPATITWTPSGGLAYTSMRINARTQANHSNGVKYKLVGGSEVSIGTSTTQTWYTLPANSTLEYIKIERPSGSNAAGLVAAVEKDGKILVNDTATPANVPAVASTVRVNQSAGFSIVKVDDPNNTQSRAHGLNKKPDLIICKSTGDTDSWHTYHSSLGYTKYVNLNSAGGATTSDQFGSQEPDSNLFDVKPNTGSGANKAGGMIYYIWTSVPGYSAFGEFTGNGSADGPFVYLGFKPSLLIIKKQTNGNWFIHDDERPGYNQNTGPLRIAAEIELTVTTYDLDILSNGFKLRTGGGDANLLDQPFIYLAWASNPFKYSRAR